MLLDGGSILLICLSFSSLWAVHLCFCLLLQCLFKNVYLEDSVFLTSKSFCLISLFFYQKCPSHSCSLILLALILTCIRCINLIQLTLLCRWSRRACLSRSCGLKLKISCGKVDHRKHIGPHSSLYSVLYAVVWIPLVTQKNGAFYNVICCNLCFCHMKSWRYVYNVSQ